MKTTTSIKKRLARLASAAAALVLAAHISVPAINIVAVDDTKTANIDFSTDDISVEVTLNKTPLQNGTTTKIEYLEDEPLLLTVQAPYEKIINTLVANGTTSLLDTSVFPTDAAGVAALWKNNGKDYTISKEINVNDLIWDFSEDLHLGDLAIATAPSDFTTASLDQSHKHATPTFTAATNGQISYSATIAEDGSLKTSTFPTDTELSFSVAAEEHYKNPVVKFNNNTVEPENNIYTITLSEPSNQLEITAEQILGHISVTADHATTSLDETKEYTEGTEVSFTVTPEDDYYVKEVTVGGKKLTANDKEEYNFKIAEGENAVVVTPAAYKDADISAEASENDNDSSATEQVKSLLDIVAPIASELEETITNLKNIIKKANSISVSLASKKIGIRGADAKELQEILAKADDQNYKIAGYYDIDLKLTAKKDGTDTTYTVKKLGSDMVVKLDISDLKLPPLANNYTRNFYVVRGHTYGDSTTAHILDATLNDNTLTFRTDSFSTYAVAYTDTFDESLFRNIDFSDLGNSSIEFVSATYDGTTYTNPAKCELFTWGKTSATLPEGTKLKFKITPADDYELASLNIENANEANSDTSPYSLIVAGQPVTISATTRRQTTVFSLAATNGTIDFLGATYTAAAGNDEDYGTDFSAYAGPFGYDEENNTITLPLGAKVKFKVSPSEGHYTDSVTYNDEELTTDEDGTYTVTLSEAKPNITANFGETVVEYETSISPADLSNGLAHYLVNKKDFTVTNVYDIDYIKIVTEGEKVTKTKETFSNQPVPISLDAGTLPALDAGYTRTFTVLYEDASGTVQPINAEAEGDKINFSTSSFDGLFAVVYADSVTTGPATLQLSADHGTVTITSATYNGTDVSGNLVGGAKVTLTITPEKGYAVASTTTTGIVSSAKNSDNVYTVVLSAGANTFTVGFTALPEEDNPGTENPGGSESGSETDPGTNPGTGTNPGGTTPGSSTPGSEFAPIGGGSQSTDANTEYFLPEDETGAIINPLKNIAAKINNLTVGKGQLTVKLTRVQNVAGYQVVYRVKGTSTWKTTTTTNLSKTIKSLKKGKKYEVKTRAYRKIAGQTFYSKWSTVKTSAKVK